MKEHPFVVALGLDCLLWRSWTGRRKVLRRFYEPLLLLHALGPTRGDRIKIGIDQSSSSRNIQKLRRSLVDSIAYICAYDKGGQFVTAVAIEKTPGGIVVWLAANGGIDGPVLDFLTDVMSDIHCIAEPEDKKSRREEGERRRDNLISKIIRFNAPRLRHYYRSVKSRFAPNCLQILDEDKGTSDQILDSLTKWLRQLFGKDAPRSLNDDELHALVRDCYRQRTTPLFEALRNFCGQGETRRLEFEQLYKLLCKLGKHVHVANTLINAAVGLPRDLGEDIEIRSVLSSKEKNLPLIKKETTIPSILNSIYSNAEERNRFMARLQFICDASELSKLLIKEQNTKTLVHAELLLIDHFDKSGGVFLDGCDRYIGCSKTACYLCHAYISHHPGRYTVPPSHQNLYLGWRPPDSHIDDAKKEERRLFQEKIMLKVIDQIRYNLIIDIESRIPRHPFHADSTAGMSSLSETLPPPSENFSDSSSPVEQDIADYKNLQDAQVEPDDADSSEEGGVYLR